MIDGGHHDGHADHGYDPHHDLSYLSSPDHYLYHLPEAAPAALLLVIVGGRYAGIMATSHTKFVVAGGALQEL